jgi:hypothetical protein
VTIWTSFYRREGLSRLEAVKVRITLGPPRLRLAYELQEYRVLAPTPRIFRMTDAAEYETAYRAALERHGVEKIAQDLERLSGPRSRDLVLLCFEEDPRECHRSIFAAWWQEQTGEVVGELGLELRAAAR